jgi:hypothetical protein
MDPVPVGPLRRRDISPVVGMARETTSIRGAFVGAAARGGTGAGWRLPWVTPNLKESRGRRDFAVLLQGTAAGGKTPSVSCVPGAGGLSTSEGLMELNRRIKIERLSSCVSSVRRCGKQNACRPLKKKRIAVENILENQPSGNRRRRWRGSRRHPPWTGTSTSTGDSAPATTVSSTATLPFSFLYSPH